MGWWKKGEMQLGDGSVDLFEEGMREFVRENGKPEWSGFLDALTAALDAGARVKAVFKPGGAHLEGDANRADPHLTQAVSEILNNIREEYREYVQRDVSTSEIVATVDFSLGVHPERFLSGKAPFPELDKLELESPA